MAYKVQKISPSSLAAAEHCPRFRPDGKDNDAAIDGTIMHEFAEELVEIPRDQWDAWIATRDTSPDMKGLLEEIAVRLRTIVVDDLHVFKDHRLRMRGGKPRKSPLAPGLYPECEIDRGQGRHGYIDLLVITPEGMAVIVDYKSNRVGKDFSLQLAAYACDINRLCPAHDTFECHIVAPRLDADEQLVLRLGPDDLAKWNRRIAAIEERADRSANDDSIPGRPNDMCQYCHWNGTCRYQAGAVATVCNATDGVAHLVGPDGPYAGEAISLRTFTAPDTPAQRGLRRSCLKFLETFIDAAKDDDKTWADQYTDEQLKTLVPGFSVSRRRGRGAFDPSKAPEVREACMSKFGLTIEDVFDISTVDKKLLVETLVNLNGMTKKAAEEAVKKLYEPFTTAGAPVLYWTQKVARRTADEW